MAGDFDWGSWSALVSSQAVSNASDYTSSAISNDVKLGTEVGIAIAYGATATEGAKIYILRGVDSSTYEAEADDPWGFMMPYSTSVTRRKTFTVPGSIGDFKILCTNDTGASVTLDVDYRQATAGT